jgi:hypothetical protein
MKKVKRYEGGGDVEEAAAKQRGLDISNKEEPMGFFERIRAGNIDDPSSEAYKRFGAGRDRPSPVPRIPPKTRMPTPNEESGKLQNLISSGSDVVGRPQDEGYRPNAGTARERAIAEGAYDSGKITENTGPRTKPVVTTAEKKPAASKPASKPAEAKPKMDTVSKSSYDGPLRGMRSDTRSSGADKRGETDMSNYKSRRSSGSSSADGRGETDMSNYKPRRSSGSSSTDTRGETDMSNYKPRRSSDAPDMSKYTPRRTPGPLSDVRRPGTNVNYENKDTSDMSYKKGGKVKKYASGGMVSGASKRADGIASKGKTRCKIC